MKSELTERKRHILAAVVRKYTETGEPVGSKALASELNLSSATIRSEMSDLAEMGLLEQPHTSAGRIPTAKGYRLYVNRLMKKEPLTQRARSAIDERLSKRLEAPDVLARAAAQILAELTDYAALSTTPADDRATVRQVQVWPLTEQTVVVAALTSSGLMKSRICRLECAVSGETLERFSRFATEHICGMAVSDFQTASLQTLVATLGDFSLWPLLTALQEALASAVRSELLLQGQSNLLKSRRFEGEQVVKLLEFLTAEVPVWKLLRDCGKEVRLVLGNETGEDELAHSGLVVCSYRLGDRDVGSVGVIGPDRMDYAKIIPSLEYVADRIGQLWTKALELDQ